MFICGGRKAFLKNAIYVLYFRSTQSPANQNRPSHHYKTTSISNYDDSNQWNHFNTQNYILLDKKTFHIAET